MCGSPSRCETTEPNQAHRLAQPSGLTDGALPSPARALSNLPGVVYFIKGAGLIKIGRTAGCVHARLSSLQTGSPVPLSLIATMKGGSATEGLLHYRFADLHEHREWFRDDGSIRRFIKRKVWDGEAMPFDWRLHHLEPSFRRHWGTLRVSPGKRARIAPMIYRTAGKLGGA